MNIKQAIEHEDQKVKRQNVTATWIIRLNCHCPCCNEYVDLLEYPDFWDGRQLVVAEHGTERSQDMEVVCPECYKTFTVRCEY